MPALRPMWVPWVGVVCLIHECQCCAAWCMSPSAYTHLDPSRHVVCMAESVSKGLSGPKEAVFHILVPHVQPHCISGIVFAFSNHVI